MKKTVLSAALLLCSIVGNAQAPKWVSNVKLSGFAIVQYQYNGMKADKSNTFNLRLGRVSLDGRNPLMIGIGKHSCSLTVILLP